MRKIGSYIIFLISVICSAQDGSLDLTYNPALGTNLYLERVLIQSDGKALIQERIQSSPYQTRITRLLTNGSIDGTFNCELGIDKPLSLGGLQSDGKIFIAQNDFIALNAFLYRLNADGSLDNSFQTLTGANGFINSGIIQPDGKIVISGTFTNYNGSAANKMIRLDSNGNIDPTFQYTDASYRVTNIKLLLNGKFLVLRQATPNSLGITTRLNSNGSIDSEFTTSSNCYLYPFSVQANEKIINYDTCVDWSFDEPPHEMIFRLNTNGTYDNTFERLGFDTTDPVAIWVLSDDSIMVTGFFNNYGGTDVKNILKLKKDGQLETSFNGGTGPNDQVWDIAQQPDGKLIIVGQFTQYNGTSRDNIARLNNSFLTKDEFLLEKKTILFPNPANDLLELKIDNLSSFYEFEIYDSNLRKIKTQKTSNSTININDLTEGIYFIKLKSDNRIWSAKFIKD